MPGTSTSSVGEFVMIERGGKKLVVHPNKGGFVFVYDRANAKVENVWRLVKNINFVKDIDPKTGELIGRRDLSLGKVDPPLCPAIAGGISWNSGAYSPKTGLYYKIGQEWCMELTVQKTTPILEPMAQLNIGADFKLIAPPDGPARGHLAARDPVTRRQEVGGHLQAAAARQRARHRGQSGVRAGCRGVCTPTTRKPARSCGRTTTARATMAASSATWPAASSTSP